MSSNFQTFLYPLLFVSQDGCNALMLASENGHREIVRDLIQGKVSLDVQKQINYLSAVYSVNLFSDMFSLRININYIILLNFKVELKPLAKFCFLNNTFLYCRMDGLPWCWLQEIVIEILWFGLVMFLLNHDFHLHKHVIWMNTWIQYWKLNLCKNPYYFLIIFFFFCITGWMDCLNAGITKWSYRGCEVSYSGKSLARSTIAGTVIQFSI